MAFILSCSVKPREVPPLFYDYWDRYSRLKGLYMTLKGAPSKVCLGGSSLGTEFCGGRSILYFGNSGFLFSSTMD